MSLFGAAGRALSVVQKVVAFSRRHRRKLQILGGTGYLVGKLTGKKGLSSLGGTALGAGLLGEAAMGAVAKSVKKHIPGVDKLGGLGRSRFARRLRKWFKR